MTWHQKEITNVVEELDSSLKGLSSEEAGVRLDRYGHNALREKKQKTPLRMFMDQFTDFMILVLIGAAVISGIGELTDTIAIVVIVILNAVIGFVQNTGQRKAMAALKKMAASAATVVRDGVAVAVPASLLCPGRYGHPEAGKVVPADMRLTESAQLKMDEAARSRENRKRLRNIQEPAR
jgi:Ca2+-transporting ATPase